VWSVIGGVVGYATDMVDDDLPRDANDFTRWITQRVMSPASPLFHEAITLLAEDPTLAAANPSLHHSILGVIANGAVTAGTIANALRRQVPAFDPSLKRLIATGFVTRHEDPLRGRRPMYALTDPFLQFHYAVLEPHATTLRSRALRDLWEHRLQSVFDARVRGPVFEEQARSWVRLFADPQTLGGEPDQIGPSWVKVDGVDHEVDMVVTTAPEAAHAVDVRESGVARQVLCIGEAKSGETMDVSHLRQLERARQAMGTAAVQAKLLLFAPAFTPDLIRTAGARPDVELVDLDRLYDGA
jgi:DNA-binding MarR family transcriptional regulator